MHMRHVKDVMSLYDGHEIQAVSATVDITEIVHVTEGHVINNSTLGKLEVRLYA